MKKLLLLLLLLPLTVMAENDTTTAGSASQAGAISGAQSGAIGLIDQSTNTVQAADFKDRAPGVFGAGVASGTNPCVVSLSGGISLPGGGINMGSAFEDGECTVRESLRLMAAISTSEEPANQVFLREIACQSVVYWDAMERTATQLDDERYLCGNPRPDTGVMPLRDRLAAPKPTPQPATVSRNIESNSWYNDNFGG